MRSALSSLMKTHFETEVCSRCHGSGKYSYCERFADICFKCQGDKIALTKRGAVAKTYLENLCTVTAENLKIGDRVSVSGMTMGGSRYSYIAAVTEINNNPYDGFISSSFIGPRNRLVGIVTMHPKYGQVNNTVSAHHNFRIYSADNSDKIAMALEYQAKLTKQGKLRKGL